MKKAARKTVQKEPRKKDATNYLIFGMIVITLILIVSMLVVQYSVVPAVTEQNNNNDNIYKPPEGSPSVYIIRPANGDTVRGSIISIKVNVTNFQLADIVANRPNVQNQGHLAYILDGGREIKSVYKDYSMANVAKGTHTLTVELRNNDDTPIVPPVRASVQIYVTG